GKNFKISIDKSNGALNSYIWNGVEQISAPFMPNFSRPLTDNDRRGWKPHEKLAVWYEPDFHLTSISTKQLDNGLIAIESRYSLIEGKAAVAIRYTINKEGVVRCDYSLQPETDLPNMPKVG